MQAAILVIICGVCVSSYFRKSETKTVVSPTDDASQFVTLTDVVPDVILEIRYYGTYNFVGCRDRKSNV